MNIRWEPWQTGKVGNNPNIWLLGTDATLDQVTAPGFLLPAGISAGDMALCTYIGVDGLASAVLSVVLVAGKLVLSNISAGSSGFSPANTLYIASNGSDANVGTNPDNPLATFSAAFAKINSTANWVINVLDAAVYTCNNLTPNVTPSTASIVVNAPAATLSNATTNPLFNGAIGKMKIVSGLLQATNPIVTGASTTHFHYVDAIVGNITTVSGGNVYIFASSLNSSTVTSPTGSRMEIEILTGNSVTVANPTVLVGRIGPTYYPSTSGEGFNYTNAYWVAVGGSDTVNNGLSPLKPFATLTKAFTAIGALGDPTVPCIIHIDDAGTYIGNYTLPTNSNITLKAPAAFIESATTSPIFTIDGGTFIYDCYYLYANGAFNPIFSFSGSSTVYGTVATSSFGILNLTPTTVFAMTVQNQLAGDINITSNGSINLTARVMSGDITDTSTGTSPGGHITLNAFSLTGNLSSTNAQVNGWVQLVNGGTITANSIAQGMFNNQVYTGYFVTPASAGTSTQTLTSNGDGTTSWTGGA